MITADKNPPAHRIARETINDFSKGLNTTINAALLDKREAQVARNVSFEQKGTLTPRRGREKRYTSDFNANPCTGLGAYYKSDNTTRLLIAAGSIIYVDTPSAIYRWFSREHFAEAGVTVSRYVDTSHPDGRVELKGILDAAYEAIVINAVTLVEINDEVIGTTIDLSDWIPTSNVVVTLSGGTADILTSSSPDGINWSAWVAQNPSAPLAEDNLKVRLKAVATSAGVIVTVRVDITPAFHRGYWISNPVDVSAIGNKTSGHLDVSPEILSGEPKFYSRGRNNVGDAWSRWYEIDVAGDLTNIAFNYVQLIVVLAK